MKDLLKEQETKRYTQFIDEREHLPEWAQREQLYNCERFYEGKKEFHLVKKIRRSVAYILRSIADAIDPATSEDIKNIA